MDDTKDGLLWNTDEAETDSPDTEWNPYDDAVNNESQDILNDPRFLRAFFYDSTFILSAEIYSMY
jgi:hypothetical protein